MYTFNVVKSGDKLIVSSNTFWSCNVYGNFTLSKYSGEGNAEIVISIPKELPYVNGEVIFSYGDERCEYPSIDIFMINDCYIRTEPMFNKCSMHVGSEECKDEKKIVEFGSKSNVLTLTFKEENESISVKVYSNGIWHVTDKKPSNINYFINGDELLISAKEGYVRVKPNIGCSDDNDVIIRMKKTE